MQDNNLKKTIKSEFNKSAKDARKAFPEKLQNLLVISTDQAIYISPEIANKLDSNKNGLRKLIQKKHRYIVKKSAAGLAQRNYVFNSRFYFSTININIITIDLNTRHTDYYSNYSRKMNIISNFDHEIGHLVTKNGFSKNRHLAECSADAYAALRHIQRFGKNTDFFYAYNRSHTIVLGNSPIHYTNGVLEKVLEISNRADISKLSLRETALLAEKIALNYSLEPKNLIKITKAFAPVANIYKNKKDFHKVIEKCLEIMLRNKDNHDIYRAGRNFLSRKDFRTFIYSKYSYDPFWRKAIKEIQEFEKTSDIILNQARAVDIARNLNNKNTKKNNFKHS